MPNSTKEINLISEERKKLINQHEVARMLNIAPSYVCMILNGQRNGKRAKEYLQSIYNIYNQNFKQAA